MKKNNLVEMLSINFSLNFLLTGMLLNVVTTHIYVLFWTFYYYDSVAKILVLLIVFLLFSTVLQIKL